MNEMRASLVALERGMRIQCSRVRSGIVTNVDETGLQAKLSDVGQGALCRVERPSGPDLMCEVIAVNGVTASLTPFGLTAGIMVGAEVRVISGSLSVPVGQQLLGRVINPLGEVIDDGGDLPQANDTLKVRRSAPDAMQRQLINEPMSLGLRALDGPVLVGNGQRIAVFGSPGAGKSSLLAAIARHAAVDVIVIALVGERGLEVRQFVERDLPAETRHRVAVVASTSDRSAAERAICASAATTVAEAFRDEGKSVLLLVDSLTRTARALREIGLSAGEVPARRGYPASVYPALPAIVERAGRNAKGSITAIYTVLTEGDDQSDPIAEEVRSLTDGHIVLSRELAEVGHFPAIDVLQSLSRAMPFIATNEHLEKAQKLRTLIAKYREIELLLQVGEYQEGNDLLADEAVRLRGDIAAFLQQKSGERSSLSETLNDLKATIE